MKELVGGRGLRAPTGTSRGILMRQRIETHLERLGSFLSNVAALSLAIMLVVVLVQVFFRYILGDSLSWSEELARYLAIWLTWLALMETFRRGEFIGLDLVANLLPSRAGKYIDSASLVLTLIFAYYISNYGWQLAVFGLNQRTATLHLPIGIIYAALPLGAAFLGLAALWGLVKLWLLPKRGEN